MTTKLSKLVALFSASIYLAGLSCTGAFAQDANTDKLPMRLARPGMSAALPASGQPFSLGVQEQHTGIPQLGVPERQDNIPQVGVNLGSREGGIPSISVGLLANYDLELIVDQSMSMLTMDCPNFMSRWQWCGAQAHDLADQLTPFAPNGLTITAFAKHYYVHQNATSQNIADLFDNPAFGRGTRLAEPLQDRLNAYFARRKPGSKPLLIAVITDGVPVPQETEPAMVANTLIDATKRIKDPHEVTVVFFQIGGGDRKGRFFLHDIDTNLVNYGARYDIVQVVSFDHLEEVGLARALLESIRDFSQEHRSGTLAYPPRR
jgi:hypothetical protein